MCDIVELNWCHEHESFNSQCCGGKKEKAGFMETAKEVEENVQNQEL